ncbi:DUF308 domain-containing protein [Halosolutus amylolyticus]|uniref:DUF308 domain-containing protein n=1 Tax=Halosolutus amylolyticus TaxID=2932267 RepID=A0ABD5PQW9_9EURY|nr:DUF308 domain-containing protein [Halosolutus amylolyticus]
MATAGASSLGGEQTTDDSGSISEDELFTLLSNQRRRHILHALMREDGPVDVGQISQEIAAWEDGTPIEKVSSTDRKRVYTALQQTHLPKMDKAGVLEYDHNHGVVEPTEALEDVEIYMDVVRGREIPWSDYYLGLTAVAAASFAVSTLEIFPFSVIDQFTWGVFVVVAFAVSALAHRFYSRRNRLGIDSEPPEVEHVSDRH